MSWDFKSFHFIKNQHILLLASKTPSLDSKSLKN